MTKFKYLLLGSHVSTLTLAGGMERTALPTAFMFEGGHADLHFQPVTTMLQIICLPHELMVMFQVQAFP